MKTIAKMIAVSALALTAPMAANAVTINATGVNALTAPESYDFGDVLTAGGTLSYALRAFENLSIGGFIIGGTDSAPNNLVNVLFGIGTADKGYDQIFSGTFGEFAEAGIMGGAYAEGTTFSIEFVSNASADVSVSGNFETTEGLGNTVVPVPAAGFLLGGVIAAGAVASRRKAKKAA